MKTIIYRLIPAVLSLLIIFSCKKDFEEINTKPDGFQTASDGSLFNGIIASLVPGGNEHMYVINEVIYKQTELAALTRAAWGNFTLGTEEMWNNYYGALAEVRELERRWDTMQSSAELNNMKAMLKVVLAYKTFKMTDVFGDMPFSEAGYGYQNLEALHPQFDSQESIYKFLLNDLQWADANFNDTAVNKEPYFTFVTFDNLFFGDLLQWQKMANSMRLRYAVRMSEKDLEFAGEVIKQVVENERPVFKGYIQTSPILEAGCIWPGLSGFSFGSTNWAFHEQKNLRMGSNIWHQMSSHDSTDGSGIFDPRAFIFYETENAGLWNAYPQLPEVNTLPPGGTPYGYHRDTYGNPANYYIKGTDNIYSPVNYFLVRGGQNTPLILVTGAEIHYLMAEIYLRGIGVPADPEKAEDEFLNGILASCDWWIATSEGFKLPSSGVDFIDEITIPDNANAVQVQNYFGWWNATNDEEKLELLYAQRWLDAYWQPWEAYALTRRTGKTPREGDPINHFRMPYPPSEVEYNSANVFDAIANQGGGDAPEFKIWWIP